MTDELFSVVVLCSDEGIELRGDEGHPFCCGQRMLTKSGICGTDYAKCEKCGKTIGNVASPHIGGVLPSEEWFSERGYWTWARLDKLEANDD